MSLAILVDSTKDRRFSNSLSAKGFPVSMRQKVFVTALAGNHAIQRRRHK